MPAGMPALPSSAIPSQYQDNAAGKRTRTGAYSIHDIHLGSSFDDFLAEENLLVECETQALKEILALQIRQSMETEGLSKTAMARRMETSRPALERLLDSGNTSVTLHTLQRAAQAIGKRLRLELIGPN